MPSLERVDRAHMQGSMSRGIGKPPVQSYSFTSVGQSQYGTPVMPGTSLGAPVGGSAVSTRECHFHRCLQVKVVR